MTFQGDMGDISGNFQEAVQNYEDHSVFTQSISIEQPMGANDQINTVITIKDSQGPSLAVEEPRPSFSRSPSFVPDSDTANADGDDVMSDVKEIESITHKNRIKQEAEEEPVSVARGLQPVLRGKKKGKPRKGRVTIVQKLAKERETSEETSTQRDNSPADVMKARLRLYDPNAKKTSLGKFQNADAAIAQYVPLQEEQLQQGKFSKRRGVGKVVVENDGDQEEEELYCICKAPFGGQDSRMMIECDICEKWYHPTCFDIPEVDALRIDRFVCELCVKATGKTSTLKDPCARPGCTQPVILLSKYCSDECGIEVATARLRVSGVELQDQLLAQVFQAKRIVSQVYDPKSNQPIQSTYHEEYKAQITAQLATLKTNKEHVKQNMQDLSYRLRYLKMAIRRWEFLCEQASLEQNEPPTASTSKASKTKGRTKVKSKQIASTASVVAPCGSDPQLTMDDGLWRIWTTSQEAQSLFQQEVDSRSPTDWITIYTQLGPPCQNTKKKCDMHNGWQNIRAADFETDLSVLNRRLERYNAKEEELKSILARCHQTSLFRDRYQNRNPTALCIKGRMANLPKTPSKPMASMLVTSTPNNKRYLEEEIKQERMQPPPISSSDSSDSDAPLAQIVASPYKSIMNHPMSDAADDLAGFTRSQRKLLQVGT